MPDNNNVDSVAITVVIIMITTIGNININMIQYWKNCLKGLLYNNKLDGKIEGGCEKERERLILKRDLRKSSPQFL